MATADRIDALRKVSLFAELGDDEIARVAEIAVERTYRKGSVIFFEEDLGDSLYVVISGAVKIYRVAPDGREKTLALLEAGEVFGEMALLEQAPRSAVAEALILTHLLVVLDRDFNRLIRAEPEIALSLLRVLSKRLRDMNLQLEDALFKDVRGRVIQTLLRLSERGREADVAKGREPEVSERRMDAPSSDGRRVIRLRLTHREIANLAGAARETVTRTLCQLQDLGYLAIEDRLIVIVDTGVLRELLEEEG